MRPIPASLPSTVNLPGGPPPVTGSLAAGPCIRTGCIICICVPVIATTVQRQNFPIVLTGVGNVTALNSATVRSLVTEQILSIDFKEGQYVKKGQLLAQGSGGTGNQFR
jgi:multidrug efflux pump subunit AcrA (membrane-fusion protein)